MTDRISRADAMGAVQEHFDDDGFKGFSDGQKMMDRINALPSAETHGMCSDLISRADAIEAVAQEWLFEASAESPYVNDDDIGEYRKLAEKLFEDVPSAEADWIPCSERLPDIGNRCLVTFSNNVVAIGALHNEDDKRWHLEPASMMIAYHEDSVTAWMPLPMPYREGSKE